MSNNARYFLTPIGYPYLRAQQLEVPVESVEGLMVFHLQLLLMEQFEQVVLDFFFCSHMT
jgi:hypothetical protein